MKRNEEFISPSTGGTITRVEGWNSLRVSAGLQTSHLTLGEEVALREYFQYEHDKKMGRWRYCENLVVYPVENHQPYSESRAVQVLDERDGKTYMRHEGRVPWSGDNRDATEAAQAYFEAHPEPKPWHDAENGQLWLLRFEDFPARDVSALVKGGYFVYNDHCHEGVVSLDDPEIISGKRIWPE